MCREHLPPESFSQQYRHGVPYVACHMRAQTVEDVMVRKRLEARGLPQAYGPVLFWVTEPTV